MDEKTLWMMFFMNIYGWQFHPGSGRSGAALTMEDCAKIADLAIMEMRHRKWLQSQA